MKMFLVLVAMLSSAAQAAPGPIDCYAAAKPLTSYPPLLCAGAATAAPAACFHEDFERTLDLTRRMRPSWSYTFKYSPREGTESAGMTDDVPAGVKEERLQRLNAVCDALTEDALAATVGTAVEVLAEEGGFGRTRERFRVSWPESGPAGKMVMVRIIGTSKRVLKGGRDERA